MSPGNPDEPHGWRTRAGLEVHVRLATETKLFCPVAFEFGAEPNTRVGPTSAGLPGSLPVLSREAVELGVRLALALGSKVQERSHFTRKHYAYPDLPKGFQITQGPCPLARGGRLELESGASIELERIHLEEDAAKTTLHPDGSRGIDLNRAGTALAEVVTLPVFEDGETARDFLEALRELLRFTGISDADLEKGSMRCDVNVSVEQRRASHPVDPDSEEPECRWVPRPARVEVKNLNSMRRVRDAIEGESLRLVEAWTQCDAGHGAPPPARETRAFVEGSPTRALRDKESPAEYAMLPEPDLPEVTVDAATLASQANLLPELPRARRERYRREFGLADDRVGQLCQWRDLGDFFEICARLSGDPVAAARWVAVDVEGHRLDPTVPARTLDELPIRPHDIATLIRWVRDGRTDLRGARWVLGRCAREGGDPAQWLEVRGREHGEAALDLDRWIEEVARESPAELSALWAGASGALEVLIGRVLRRAGGRADPLEVRRRWLARGFGPEPRDGHADGHVDGDDG